MTATRRALAGMVDMFERHISGRPGPDDAAERWDNARAALEGHDEVVADLVIAMRGAIAALKQPKTHPADVKAALSFLRNSLGRNNL